MKESKVRLAVCIIMMLFSVVGVFAGGNKESAASSAEITFKDGWTLAEAAAPWKGETLRFIGEALPPLEALADVKEEFEAITGVKVEIEQYGQAEVIEKTMADFVGGTRIYDLIISPHRQLGAYVENDWILPLGEFLNNNKLRDPDFNIEGGALLDEYYWHEVSWYNNKAYGLPFHFITMYLWYRYDIFEEASEIAAFKRAYGYDLPNPPVTMKEYYDVAEFFTREKGEKLAGKVLDRNFYGNTIQGKRHVSSWYDFLNFLYPFGGRELYIEKGSDYGKIGINSREAVKAMEYYKSLVPFCPPGVLTFGWDESQAAMQQDIAVMGIEWDDAVGAVENPKESLVAGKIAYSGPPIEVEKAVQVEGWSYLIPKKSNKPELAWLFIQWAMGDLTQKKQMEIGGQSAVRSVYDDADIAKLPYTPTAVYLKTRGAEVLGIREKGDATGWGVPRRYMEAINPATNTTEVTLVPKPTFPEQEELVEAIVLSISNAISGEMTAKEAMDQTADVFKQVLGDKVD
ncbi:MAG: extracellular solute-binding protein [Spirochaetales bacterium]|nr:extracellular solute-binding protein [Spirochaetales bacterium]